MSETTAGPADELRREEAGLLACVHCGFCLNACPTYTRLGHEGDSPRGRLDLMRAVVEGRLDPDDPAFRLHIDQCLGCRACEPVCPSGVPYGFLLERARSAMAEAVGVSPSTRLLIAAYTGPFAPVVTAMSRTMRRLRIPAVLARALPGRLFGSARFAMAMLASSAPWPGLRTVSAGGRPRGAGARAVASARTVEGLRGPDGKAAERMGDLAGNVKRTADSAGNAERAFADPHALMAAYPRATGATTSATIRHSTGIEQPRRAGILTGCVQESLFARVNRATERVLAVNGAEMVHVPGQRCCGALDAHAGLLDRARDLARANIAAFEEAGVDDVVINAAGCGAMMKEYPEQLRHDPEWADRARAFAKRVRDVSEYLVEHGIRQGGALDLRVTYDAPCHLHHGQRIRDAPMRTLDAVPGLDRVPLADADECCGGAGLYGVHHPDLGGRILADKIAAVRATGADVVVTPNPGCMMQIGAGLLLEGETTRVLHPIEVLDESYRRASEELG